MKSKKKSDEGEDETDDTFTSTVKLENVVFYCRIVTRMKEIKGIFDTMKETVKKMPIKILKPKPDDRKSGGFLIEVLDRRTGGLVKQRIFSGAFEEFYVSPDITKEYQIGADAKMFSTLLKQVNNTDILELYIDKYATDDLIFKFFDRKSSLAQTRKLRLMQMPNQEIRIPHPAFACQVTIKCSVFQNYIKDSSVLTEDICVSFIDTPEYEDTLRIEDPKENASCVFTRSTKDYTVIKNKSNIIIKNIYSLKNLIIFNKSSSYCTYVDLFLNENFPLFVKYQIDDDCGFTLLILSPKNDIKHDDDDDDEEDSDTMKKPKKAKAPSKKDEDDEEENGEDEEEDEDEEEEDEDEE